MNLRYKLLNLYANIAVQFHLNGCVTQYDAILFVLYARLYFYLSKTHLLQSKIESGIHHLEKFLFQDLYPKYLLK